jgi:glycosyltransferase involved in cell wall biosynthesis
MEYALTMDADGQHNPTLIPRFLVELDNGADIVLGVRDRMQRITEKLFSLVGKYVWGINDPLCGMKAYRMSLYGERGHFDSYSSVGTELAIYAIRRNKVLSQVFVETRPRCDNARFGNRVSGNLKIARALLLAFIYR